MTEVMPSYETVAEASSSATSKTRLDVQKGAGYAALKRRSTHLDRRIKQQ